MPDGVVNVVTGTGAEAGARLAEHPDVDKIVFTGSTATGQAIIRASCRQPQAGLAGARRQVADHRLRRRRPRQGGSGRGDGGVRQFGPDLHRRLAAVRGAEIHDEFVERLGEFASALRIGDGIEPETEIGPLICRRQLDKVEGYLRSRQRRGRELVAGGSRLNEATLYDGGNFIAPTVFAGVSDKMTIAREEIFGPVISAMPFDTLDEAVTRANATPYGLAAGVFTTRSRARRTSSRAASGPARSGSTPITPSTRRCRSAATR